MTAEANHHELHDQQRKLVPLSLMADDSRETFRNVYVIRKAPVIPLPEPPRAA